MSEFQLKGHYNNYFPVIIFLIILYYLTSPEECAGCYNFPARRPYQFDSMSITK